jgi:outer membrane protein OmpA-like peptidoglycan-associated protein
MYKNRGQLLILVGLILLESHLFAQIAQNKPAMDLQLYWPSPGPGNYFTVRGTPLLPNMNMGVNLLFHYQRNPFFVELIEKEANITRKRVFKPIKYQVGMEILWALGILNRAQLGIAFPAVIDQEGDNMQGYIPGEFEKVKAHLMRDIRFDLKGRILGPDPLDPFWEGLGLGIAFEFSIPTGDRENFAGNKGLVFSPALIADYTHSRFSLALNLGARIREKSQTDFFKEKDKLEGDKIEFKIGNQFTYGLGAQVYFMDKRLSALIDFTGLYGREDKENPIEIRGGIRGIPDKHRDLTITVGAGAGIITEGYGSPEVRVIGELIYAPLNYDRDHDGIFDRQDRCLSEPEDKDEFEDEDGCPDPDDDKDGISDKLDKCRLEAEDKDKFEDKDGCPDPDNDKDEILDEKDKCPDEAEDKDKFEDEDGCLDPDNDKDEVLDDKDSCPQELEDKDEFEDKDGCPDPDNDKDEILDEKDKCPDEAEDKDKFEDKDGCPELDNDKDGVFDTTDKCPEEKEVINGKDDEDGCPDKGRPQVQIKEERLLIKKRVAFPKDSIELEDPLSSILNQIALTLIAHSEIKKIEIRGFADKVGDTPENKELALKRAEKIKSYLIAKGVKAERLEAKIGDLTQKRPRRRIQAEFIILK